MKHRARSLAHRTAWAGCALLAMLACAQPAGAADENLQPHAWEATAHYDFMTFSKDRDDWHTYFLGVRRKFERVAVGVEAIGARRFETDAAAGAVNASLPLWPRAYADLRLQVADGDVLPRTDGLIELFQGFGTGWEASASYRHVNVPVSDVHVIGVSLAKYIGDDWYLRARLIVMTTADDVDETQAITIRRYLGNLDTYVQLDAGLGREIVDVSAGPRVESRRVVHVGLRAQTFFTRNVGVAVSGIYRDEHPGPSGVGAAIELLGRW